MRKVAIVKSTYSCDGDSSYCRVIAESITEWTEVSEEDYKALLYGLNKLPVHDGYYNLIEFPSNQKEIITNTVTAYLAACKKQEEAEKKRRKAQEELNKVRAEKKKEKEREKYLALKAKFEESCVNCGAVATWAFEGSKDGTGDGPYCNGCGSGS